jgi:hypothetical protein
MKARVVSTRRRYKGARLYWIYCNDPKAQLNKIQDMEGVHTIKALDDRLVAWINWGYQPNQVIDAVHTLEGGI